MPKNKTSPLWIVWHGEDLRTRFRPRSRIGNVFFQVVPWLNVMVIIALFLMIANRVTLAPSVSFNLPQAAFSEGAENCMKLVMLAPANPEEGPLVFFDDVRYRVNNPTDTQNLRQSFANVSFGARARQVLLLADKDIKHGEVIKIVDIARKAGIQRINVAVKPE